MRVLLGGSKCYLVALSIMCWECIYSMRVHRRGVRVFLGVSKYSLVALSVMCWDCVYSMRVHVSLTIALVRL